FSGCTRCLRCKELSYSSLVYPRPLRRSCAIAFRPQRDRKEERAALADLAFNPDASAVHLHEFLRDAEAEPRSAELARGRRVDLTELRKHILQLFLRNADAGIRDAVDELAVQELHPDLDPPLL